MPRTARRAAPLPAHRRPDALRIGRSRIHGRGLFAAIDLPARRKLGEMSGTLVRLPAARHEIEGDAVIQFVEISRRWALDCRKGNAFRHLNHSCTPNAYLRIRGRAVEVYTLTAIRRGTELTCDYGLTPHADGMTCSCGAVGCRGRL